MSSTDTKSVVELKANEAQLLTALKLARATVESATNHVAQLERAYLQLHQQMNQRAVAEMGNVTDWALLLKRTPAGDQGHAVQMLRSLLYGKSSGPNQHAGLYQCGGFHPETEQFALEVRLSKNDSALTDLTVKLLDEVLPHFLPSKPITAGNPERYKYISVGEHTEVVSTNHYLAIREDLAMYELHKSVWGHSSRVHKAKSLQALLTFVQKHHPYRLAPK